MNDLVGVHVVAGPNDLDQKEACLGLCKTAAAAEHVHEGAIVTELEGHVNVVVVFKTFVEADDIGMCQRAMDLDLGIQLVKCERDKLERSGRQTLVFAFLVLRDVLVTTLQAWRVPRTSLTS